MTGAVSAGALAGAGLLIGGDVPFRLEASSLLSSAALLIAAGMVGSLVALRRITTVDPAIALAAQP